MKTPVNSERKAGRLFACSAWLGVWIKKTIASVEALFLAARIVSPYRPRGVLGVAVCKNAGVCSVDDLGDLRLNGMTPSQIFAKYGAVRVFTDCVWNPLFGRLGTLRQLVPMYRWIKCNRATESVGERHLELVRAHTPNDPSSATAADGDAGAQKKGTK